MQSEAGVPFVARDRKLIAPPTPAGPEHHYDALHQLWRCATTGEAAINRHATRDELSLMRSQFGETTLTKTSEGADQGEGRIDGGASSVERAPSLRYRSVVASEFGETSVTESGEGHDQAERTAGV